MNHTIYSYRFAQEILEHPKYSELYNEILKTISDCPLYIYPNKSSNNATLDIMQQLLNAYFDVKFHANNNWKFHPLATDIEDSGLKADFRKEHNELKVHVEVQFGNMARWYSDIFKFQTAYSTNLIDIGICIVPLQNMGKRIDSNVTHYERILKELPAADMSITHPILIVGISPGDDTLIIDVSNSQFSTPKECHKGDNKYRIVNGLLAGNDINTISANSSVGLKPIV